MTHCTPLTLHTPHTAHPSHCTPLTLHTPHTAHPSHCTPLTLHTPHTAHPSHYTPLTLHTQRYTMITQQSKAQSKRVEAVQVPRFKLPLSVTKALAQFWESPCIMGGSENGRKTASGRSLHPSQGDNTLIERLLRCIH